MWVCLGRRWEALPRLGRQTAGTFKTHRRAARSPAPAQASKQPTPGSPLAIQVGAARELQAGGLDVLRAHQRLADQHRVHADALELFDLIAFGEARLGDDGLAGG